MADRTNNFSFSRIDPQTRGEHATPYKAPWYHAEALPIIVAIVAALLLAAAVMALDKRK